MQIPEEVTGSVGESEQAAGAQEVAGEAGARLPLMPLPAEGPFIPYPIILNASGLYEWSLRYPFLPQRRPLPQRIPIPVSPSGRVDGDELRLSPFYPILMQREELRLDVDGRYPQMVASGTLYSGYSLRIHWIANLNQVAVNTYSGYIWYKDGNTAWLPHTNVTIQVVKSFYANQRKATLTFSGGGAPNRVRTYSWKSSYFRPVEFEFDTVQGTSAVTSINTGAHPNRPAGLPIENLSIDEVFQRAGFNVSAGTSNVIPLAAAGANARWSDMEMHDAMQVHWSRFSNKAQWAMWVLFAGLHEAGTSLGGIMFDDIGPNHRQGTALFNNSFIANPPTGDASPAAWVARMKFWTACHEMGHAFNLAHSWQKSLGTPWIPLSNEPEARSFMNYPYFVSGGQNAFFADFEYRFSDGELLFMRHAPERFVQMGNADWFDHHGFEQAETSPAPLFALEVRFHRTSDRFEFMEPVMLELKLKNISGEPQIVEESLLRESDHLTVVIKQQGKPARQWRPFAQYCFHGEKKVLEAGESLYAPLNIAMGLNGWDIAEPGVYMVQAALQLDGEDIVSKALRVRVAPPRGYEQELIAQDLFSEEVARVLTFHGSRALTTANDTLREVVDRLGDAAIVRHARLALGNPLTRRYKMLQVEEEAAVEAAPAQAFDVLEPEPEEARKHLREALMDDPTEATDTLGHIDYKEQVEAYGAFLARQGDPEAAASSLEQAEQTLEARKVKPAVLRELTQQRKRYARRGGS